MPLHHSSVAPPPSCWFPGKVCEMLLLCSPRFCRLCFLTQNRLAKSRAAVTWSCQVTSVALCTASRCDIFSTVSTVGKHRHGPSQATCNWFGRANVPFSWHLIQKVSKLNCLSWPAVLDIRKLNQTSCYKDGWRRQNDIICYLERGPGNPFPRNTEHLFHLGPRSTKNYSHAWWRNNTICDIYSMYVFVRNPPSQIRPHR